MLKTESYRKGIVFSTGLNIIARGVGFLNTLILAFYFGANASTDIYFMVLSVAMIITGIINGNDLFVLIPEAMKLRERKSDEASQRFLNFFLYLYACIGILIATVVIASPVLFFSIFSKFNSTLLSQNSKILYVGSIIILFQLLNNLLGSILSSYKFFTASILTGLINSVFAILLTIFFHKQLGIIGTISGIAIGYVINFILLIFLLKRYQKWDFSKVNWMKDKTVLTNIALIQINILPIWLRNSIGLYLLSGFDKGMITALNLGQQLVAIPEIFITSQLIAVAGIKFNELHATHNDEQANRTFLLLSKMGIAFTTVMGFCFFLLSTNIIHVVYSHSSLSDSTLKNIALVFSFMIFCLPTRFMSALSTNIATAYQKIKPTILIAFIIHSCVTVIFIFLVKYWGLLGYLIGTNLHFYLFFFIAVPLFKRTLVFLEYRKVIIYFFKDLLLNAIVCGLCYLLFRLIFPVIQSQLVELIIGLGTYFVLLLVINELFNINEVLKVSKYKDYVSKKFLSRTR